MDRRTLLKGGLALLLPFTMAGKAIGNMRGVYYSPFMKNLGKAVSINIEQSYNMEPAFEMGQLGPYSRYLTFPLEVKVKIEYERGWEEWIGFNMKNDGLKNFSLRKFFNSPFINGSGDFGGRFEYCGVKFQLASIAVKDDSEISL